MIVIIQNSNLGQKEIKQMPKPLKYLPECIYGNPCRLVCINPQCRKPGFVCQNGVKNRQECALFHQICQKIKWSELQTILSQNPHTKIPEFIEFQDQMQLFFTDLLKKIKEEHAKFSSWTRTYGYSEELMNFINIINEGNFNQISGDYMNQILTEIYLKEDKNINTTFNFKAISQIRESLNNLLSNCTKVYKFSERTKIQIPETFEQPSYNQIDVLDSKITKQIDYIRSLFNNSKPITFSLLYRASDCQFSVAEFHKRCDNVPNTLLLVETEYGKTIGGFTPLPWNSSKKHWTTDKTLSSFIFSVDLNQQFQLNLAQFAVACNPEKGPIFGCCDICIVDKSNVEKSNAQFPISYNNFKYNRNEETSMAFTGSLKGKFCTKQWEIFHIEFEQEKS